MATRYLPPDRGERSEPQGRPAYCVAFSSPPPGRSLVPGRGRRRGVWCVWCVRCVRICTREGCTITKRPQKRRKAVFTDYLGVSGASANKIRKTTKIGLFLRDCCLSRCLALTLRYGLQSTKPPTANYRGARTCANRKTLGRAVRSSVSRYDPTSVFH